MKYFFISLICCVSTFMLITSCSKHNDNKNNINKLVDNKCEVISKSSIIKWTDNKERECSINKCKFGDNNCIVYISVTKKEMEISVCDNINKEKEKVRYSDVINSITPIDKAVIGYIVEENYIPRGAKVFPCDGRYLDPLKYSKLFTAIGYSWDSKGGGDFPIPNTKDVFGGIKHYIIYDWEG